MTPNNSAAPAAGEPFGPFPESVQADVDRIFELIRARDPQRGAVTRFADWIGCRRQSLWNLRNPGRRISLEFASQIAAALRVDLSEIIQHGDTAGNQEPPQPHAEAA